VRTQNPALSSRFLSADRRALWGKALSHGLFGIAPLIITGGVLYLLSRTHYLAYDFHHSYWIAARRLLHGLSLYGPAATSSANLPGYVQHSLVVDRTLFVYPAPAALFLAPFGLIPRDVADWVFSGVCIGSVLLALRALDVRDWRIYGVALMWPPVISGYQNGNLSLLLVLGVALAWRYRDRPALSGLLIAVMISAKIIVWPLSIWLLATRRYAAFAYAVLGTVVFNLIAFGLAGFHQASRYFILMRALTHIEEKESFNVLSLVLHSGVGYPLANALAFAIAAAAAVICVILGRRRDDRRAFVWAIGVALLATPVIWSHYYALLIVPLALARPRLSAAWLLAVLLWIPVAHESWKAGSWQLVAGLIIVIALFVVSLSERREPQADEQRRRTQRGARAIALPWATPYRPVGASQTDS
jgi:hypothetical protein